MHIIRASDPGIGPALCQNSGKYYTTVVGVPQTEIPSIVWVGDSFNIKTCDP